MKKNVSTLFAALLSLLMCVGVFVTASATVGRAQPLPRYSEYEVKAAYIYNFLRFVRWPRDMLDKREPIIIRTLGSFADNDYIKRLNDRPFGDHTIKILEWSDKEAKQKCHILFVAAGAEDKLAKILEKNRYAPTFVVADSDSMIGHGAVLAFYTEKNHIRFKIDRAEAKRRKLRISSRLLSLAKIVNTDKDKESQHK